MNIADVKKHIMDTRKYIFFNLAALWSYFYIWSFLNVKISHEPCTRDMVMCPNDLVFAFLILTSLYLVGLFFLGFVEVLARKLIRKFIIDKYFSDIKLNVNIKIPKFIVIPYNVLFFTGFFIGFILFLIIVLGTINSAIYAKLH